MRSIQKALKAECLLLSNCFFGLLFVAKFRFVSKLRDFLIMFHVKRNDLFSKKYGQN